ncbi:carbohydrate-binding module family 14 protein [Streptomyces uncialis]|uniref:carbohydrate-binding module family 14 protein n=1 Tax=Streptomyces uncialis TaxID=1048205 RepID=UPI00379EA2A4
MPPQLRVVEVQAPHRLSFVHGTSFHATHCRIRDFRYPEPLDISKIIPESPSVLKKFRIASMLTATAAMGSASPALATSPAPHSADTPLAASAPADDPAAPHKHTIGRCSPGLLFDSSKLTCDYAGLVNTI